MYFVKTPNIVKLFYPSLVWDLKDNEKNIYLTFDDGPDEGITPEVLDLLDLYNAKATFFCVGEKVIQNPDLYREITNRGHSIGNHSFNHIKGKLTSLSNYLGNIDKAKSVINSILFRPPYGSISYQQIKKLKKDYKIIMWSVLPGDFDKRVSKEEVLKRSIQYTKPGSIIVFHDNKKFMDTMMFALRGFFNHYKALGYNFKSITEDLYE